MIFRILFLVIFCILSVSCSFIGDKFSSDTTTASPDQPKAASESKSKKPKIRQKLAKKSKSLELPPDLVSSANDQIKENAEVFAQPRVLPEIVGARIQKQDDKVWLEIDTNVESVWNTVSEYWTTNGVSLVEYSPEAGTMETEWIKKETALSEGGSVVKQLFKSLLNTVANRNAAVDKYRIRFERISPNKTAMYANHRATARRAIERNRDEIEFQWVELPENPERVIDFLQNIILIFDQSE